MKRHSPRILVCAKAFPPAIGGVETYSEHVARAYAGCGCSPLVLTAFEGPLGWQERHYKEGIVRIFNVGVGTQPMVFARMLRHARHILRTEQFDFLHATTWRPALALLPWRNRKPLVITVHGREVLIVPKPLKPLMTLALRSAQMVVAVSRATKSAAAQALSGAVNTEGWTVAFNGISYRIEAEASPERLPAKERIIYSFCRLEERKNIHRAVRALSILKQRGIGGFRYLIAGRGPEYNRVAQLIEEFSLDDTVKMLGYLDDDEIVDRYREADIFLHPQTAAKDGKDIEGFGLVIADAMSFGAAAIVGSAGGPADFVRDGTTGLVVDGEEADEIADALARLLLTPNLLAAIQREGRAWVLNKLSWDTHVTTILDGISPVEREMPAAVKRV